MTLIEGVGDEVTDFFIVVGVLCVGWIAWYSTDIADQPLIRTVLILQNRRFFQRTRAHLEELRSNGRTTAVESPPATSDPMTTNETDTSLSEENRDVSDRVPAESTDSSPTAASAEQILTEAMDSLDGDDAELLSRSARSSSLEEEASRPDVAEEQRDEEEITIKLKFMNDDQKLVMGRLEESLGEFKRRHFQVELESRKRIRLVFNGKLLQPDGQTLERCGLYNNCVVHCLVHQQRVATSSGSRSNAIENSLSVYSSPRVFSNLPSGTGLGMPRNDWDLSRLLVSSLTLILAFAWYSRYHYAQLFTATTTLALYALTAIFTLSMVGHFFPDQDNLRNVE